MFDIFKTIYDRDPACRGIKGFFEILFTYSSFHATVLHRISHLLYKLKIPLLPRLIQAFMRFITGIEIHPGAKIGKRFFIDHGTGVVIGETTIIGNDVTLFQGVTLGGTGKETGKRHPTLLDHVTVGAGAKVLGNITIGKNVKIGANSVVLKDVPDNCTVVGVPGRIAKIKDKKILQDSLAYTNMADPLETKLLRIQKEIEFVEKKLNIIREHSDDESDTNDEIEYRI